MLDHWDYQWDKLRSRSTHRRSSRNLHQFIEDETWWISFVCVCASVAYYSCGPTRSRQQFQKRDNVLTILENKGMSCPTRLFLPHLSFRCCLWRLLEFSPCLAALAFGRPSSVCRQVCNADSTPTPTRAISFIESVADPAAAWARVRKQHVSRRRKRRVHSKQGASVHPWEES